jgi:hypothetical protein
VRSGNPVGVRSGAPGDWLGDNQGLDGVGMSLLGSARRLRNGLR